MGHDSQYFIGMGVDVACHDRAVGWSVLAVFKVCLTPIRDKPTPFFAAQASNKTVA